jgi:toxin HigB-1
MLPRIRILLGALSSAKAIEELGLATFRLHPLKGDRRGFWSLTVKANWRIVFRFETGDAYDVDFVDYH